MGVGMGPYIMVWVAMGPYIMVWVAMGPYIMVWIDRGPYIVVPYYRAYVLKLCPYKRNNIFFTLIQGHALICAIIRYDYMCEYNQYTSRKSQPCNIYVIS